MNKLFKEFICNTQFLLKPITFKDTHPFISRPQIAVVFALLYLLCIADDLARGP